MSTLMRAICTKEKIPGLYRRCFCVKERIHQEEERITSMALTFFLPSCAIEFSSLATREPTCVRVKGTTYFQPSGQMCCSLVQRHTHLKHYMFTCSTLCLTRVKLNVCVFERISAVNIPLSAGECPSTAWWLCNICHSALKLLGHYYRPPLYVHHGLYSVQGSAASQITRKAY